MMNIKLIVVSPDGTLFNDDAEFIKIRTTEGDIGIKGEHANYFSVINFAQCTIKYKTKLKYAACFDGYISVKNKNEVKLVATCFEWAQNIDVQRATLAYSTAKANVAANSNKSTFALGSCTNKMRRAQMRLQVAEQILSNGKGGF